MNEDPSPTIQPSDAAALAFGPLQLSDTLTFLLGAWRLDRTIVDHRAGSSGSFVGEASLVDGRGAGGSGPPERAHYEEAGELRIGAYRGPARRSLAYVRLDNGSVLLCFGDGRPFIDLDLSTGACQRVHDCGEDRYEIEVSVRSGDVIEERWRVQGPRKDYEAVTTLSRRIAGDIHPGLGA